MNIFSKAELAYIKNPRRYEINNVDYAYVLRHRIIKKIKAFFNFYEEIKANPFLMKSLISTRSQVQIQPKAIDALLNIAAPQLLQEFFTYLCNKGISDSWAKKYTRIAIRYANEVKDGIDAKAFLERYQNANTYNNMLKAIIHLHRFLNIPEPDLKFKPITKDRLIIAPSYEEIMAGLQTIHKNVDFARFYLLCSTTLLRPQFIVTLNWEHIDLTNKLINVKVDKKTKHYRPQILHSALIPYIEDKQGKVFAHTYDYYGKKIRMLTGITPSRLRDFAYNAMPKSGMNYLVVEWLMGHNIGMAAHYLADNIREEYTKFERAYTFNIDT